MLPCLTVMSCCEIEAGAWVASSLPAIFGLVEIDQAKAITATAAIAARIMRLRIYRLLIPDELRNGIGILCAEPVGAPSHRIIVRAKMLQRSIPARLHDITHQRPSGGFLRPIW